jgi:hypothetical protein
MRWGRLAAVIGFALFAGILGVNVLTPPDNAKRLIEYALPPIPQTAGGLVLPTWRKPIHVVIITDDVGGNSLATWIKEFLRTIGGSASLTISSVDLQRSNVGRGEGKLVICVCKDIFAVARNQLRANLEYQLPNEVERTATLNQDEQKDSDGFAQIRLSSATREVDSATIYLSTDAPPSFAEEAAWYIFTAISPQLDYKQRAQGLTAGHGWSVKPTEFGKLYMSLMLSEHASPGMSRDDFEKAARKHLGN